MSRKYKIYLSALSVGQSPSRSGLRGQLTSDQSEASDEVTWPILTNERRRNWWPWAIVPFIRHDSMRQYLSSPATMGHTHYTDTDNTMGTIWTLGAPQPPWFLHFFFSPRPRSKLCPFYLKLKPKTEPIVWVGVHGSDRATSVRKVFQDLFPILSGIIIIYLTHSTASGLLFMQQSPFEVNAASHWIFQLIQLLMMVLS